MDRRKFIVGASVGAMGLGAASSTVGAQAFDPDISIWDMRFEVNTGGDPPDEVLVHTTDGTTHEFTDLDDGFLVGGYTSQGDDGWFGEGWFGFVEEVEVTRDGETATETNDDVADWDITCSYVEGFAGATDLRVSYADAHKMYDPPVGDDPTHGSPGRVIQRVEDASYDWRVEFGDRDCDPEDDPAVTFDCTSVTVEPEEFVNGNEEFYRPEITFSDGESQLLDDDEGDGYERFEPPETFEGTGDHEGKVIEELTIWNDSSGEAMFSYTNPDVEDCESGEAGDGPFEPDITVDDLEAQVHVGGEPADEVVVRTADGTTREFSEDLHDPFRCGYVGSGEPGWIGEGWHGVLEEVEVTRGDETVTAENDDPSDMDVTCSFVEDYEDAADLRVYYEHATKLYDPPAGDEPVFGSPGRVATQVEELGQDAIVELGDRDCEPEDDPAVTFDCTSVTVDPEEFVNGNEEFYWPHLHFVDGEMQRFGEHDEPFEPPVTLEGSGEHEGKVVESVTLWNDAGGEAMFTYWNPDLGECDGVEAEEVEDDPGSQGSEPGPESPANESASGSGSGTAADGTDSGTEDGDGPGGPETPADDSDDGTDEGTDDGAGDDATDDDGTAGEAEGEGDETFIVEVNADGPGFGGLAALGGLGSVATYLARKAGADDVEE